jgi:hypothetical protein
MVLPVQRKASPNVKDSEIEEPQATPAPAGIILRMQAGGRFREERKEVGNRVIWRDRGVVHLIEI